MKCIYFILILSLISFSAIAGYMDQYLLETEQSDFNPNQRDAGTVTRDALMSIEAIQERSDYLVYKLKTLTFGEYTDDVMVIAPLITGEIEFSANQFNLYYNHFQSRGGVRYQVAF